MKLKRKILVLFLIVWLNLFQPLVVLSQEATPTETIIPTETPSPTPTSAAIITTGDALSGNASEVTVNSTGQTLPGDMGSCNLEIGCSSVDNQNTADVGVTSTVDSDSGNNEIGATTSISTIDTGDVLGLINGTNEANQNQIVIIIETDPGATPNTGSQVINNNLADINNTNDGDGNSGNNQNTNSGGDGTINTGDVSVVANLVNQVNTNQIGSNIKILLINNPSQDKQDLDLNKVWRDLISIQTNSMSVVDVTNQLVVNQNQGSISNLMMLSGNSGNNSMEVTGDGYITTGNTTVLANLINLLNINLIGSRIFLGVINIRGDSLGNIILPNPEMFSLLTNDQNGGKETTFQWTNEANINQDVDVNANSGSNSAVGEQSAIIQSGNSTTLVNSQTYANINSVSSNWYTFKINTLGGWEGEVINWGNPGSVAMGMADQYSLTPVTNAQAGLNSGTLISINQNEATIYNQLLLSANSGNNLLSANNAGITTGSSTAIANIYNLANLNVWGSNWFWGTVNVIGNWKGNTIFAYPDLTVSLRSNSSRVKRGERVEYNLNYSNLGYDVAQVGRIEMSIPEGVSFAGDNSNLRSEVSGNKITWHLKALEPKDGGSFSFWLNTDNVNQQAEGRLSLVKTVIAAEAEEELMVNAMISTSQSESNLNNNSSMVATIVWTDYEETTDTNRDNQEEGSSSGLPKWQIAASNNVNDFVYPGDVVTFQVEAKNVGEDTAFDSYVIHQIFDTKDNLLRTDTINLGEVGVGRGGKVNFGIKMPTKFSRTTPLKTITQVVGFNRDKYEVRSEKASTTFRVKVRGVATIEAKTENTGEVLGTGGTVCEINSDYLPYLLLFVVSGFWLTRQTKIWLGKIKKK